MNRKLITIQGSGKSARDFIYVKDAVQAFLKAMNYTNKKQSEVFNICTGHPTTVNELVKKLIFMADKNIEIKRINDKADNFLVGNSTKAHELLGFKSKCPLDDGLKETMEWFRASRSKSTAI